MRAAHGHSLLSEIPLASRKDSTLVVEVACATTSRLRCPRIWRRSRRPCAPAFVGDHGDASGFGRRFLRCGPLPQLSLLHIQMCIRDSVEEDDEVAQLEAQLAEAKAKKEAAAAKDAE